MSLPVYNTQLVVQRDDVPALVINPNNPPPWLQNSTAQIVYVQNYVQPYMNIDQNMYIQQYVQNPMYVNVDPRIIVDSNQIYQTQSMPPTDKTNFMQIRPMRPTRNIRPRTYRQIQPRLRYPNVQRVQNMQIVGNEAINGLSNVRAPNVAINGGVANNNLNTNIRATMSNVAISGAMSSQNMHRPTMSNVINGTMSNESLNPNWNRTLSNVTLNGANASNNTNASRTVTNAASNCNIGPNTLYTLSSNNNVITMSSNDPMNITNIAPNSINTNAANLYLTSNGVNFINSHVMSNTSNIHGTVNLSNIDKSAAPSLINTNNVANVTNGAINAFNVARSEVPSAISASNIVINNSENVASLPNSNVTNMGNAWPNGGSNVATNIGPNYINITPINGPIGPNVSRPNVPNVTQMPINTMPNVNIVGPIQNTNEKSNIHPTNVSHAPKINLNNVQIKKQSVDQQNIVLNVSNPVSNPKSTKITQNTTSETGTSKELIGNQSDETETIPDITITRIENRKRKSQSPDEIKNKLHILDINKSQDKLRNTVFTQARGRILKKNAKENEVPVDENIRKINKGLNKTDEEMKLTEKDFVLTHVLDGFVIQESNVAFPIRKPIVEKTIRLCSDALKDLEDEIPTIAIVKETKAIETDTEENGKRIDIIEKELKNDLSESKKNSNEKQLDKHEKREGKKIKKECLEVNSDDGNPFSGLSRAVVKKWTMEQLTNHLSSSGWEETASALFENEIDGESLLLVSKLQLLVIGVKEEHADVIMTFVHS